MVPRKSAPGDGNIMDKSGAGSGGAWLAAALAKMKNGDEKGPDQRGPKLAQICHYRTHIDGNMPRS